MLKNYGYNDEIKREFEAGFPGYVPARIIAEHKSNYIIVTNDSEIPATLTGKYLHNIEQMGGKPCVGDFVAVTLAETGDRAVIHEYMERRTFFYRADSFAGGLQAIASNFDYVFICMAQNEDFSIPRLERYIALAKESGAEAVVVLTKSDISIKSEENVAKCRAINGDFKVHSVSALFYEGIEEIKEYFKDGKTVVAVGSSGTGKSTLLNALFGQQILRTAEIRQKDGKGRHTTVHRQIILLPSGGLYMDTPGIREVGLSNAEEGISDVHGDIESLVRGCKYSDCTHQNEPDCKVREAIIEGVITRQRFERYLKQKKESQYYDNKDGYMLERTQRFKEISKFLRQNPTKKR